jgi:L,D-transpeptidase ErfK/SrfK
VYIRYFSSASTPPHNGKQVTDRLHAGDTIHIDNRHIVPIEESDLIEVNLPQRMLFHFEEGRLGGAYPVAIGQPGKQWQTPIGSFTVIQTREDPTWRVPAVDSARRGRAGQEGRGQDRTRTRQSARQILDRVKFPGDRNSWNQPISVYSYRTHRCVRLHPDDIEASLATKIRTIGVSPGASLPPKVLASSGLTKIDAPSRIRKN